MLPGGARSSSQPGTSWADKASLVQLFALVGCVFRGVPDQTLTLVVQELYRSVVLSPTQYHLQPR